MTTKDHRQIDSELACISKVLKAPRISATISKPPNKLVEMGGALKST